MFAESRLNGIVLAAGLVESFTPRGVLRTFRRLDERRPVSFEVLVPYPPLVIRASGPHRVRVVSNLVLNAADSIQATGAIAVRAFERQLTSGLEAMQQIGPGDHAVIEVADTGAGTAPRSRSTFRSSRSRSPCFRPAVDPARWHRAHPRRR